MHTILRKKIFPLALLLVVVALLGAGLHQGNALAALGFPGARTALADTLLPDTCEYDIVTNTRTCELWATTGTIDLPGSSGMPIWGYADSATGAATLPGPALIANAGETLVIKLNNKLSEATALQIVGVDMIPDLDGVPAYDGITVQFTSYNFPAVVPGTYLYEAGPLPNAQHQATMGLFGALVVRPASGVNHAYDANSAFEDEALVVLSEVDPALNNSADPASFDMRDYKPKYWLINGQAYPDTDQILTVAGNKVLLRYLNAGLQPHTMGLLGLDQTLIARDGSPFPYPRKVVAETIAPGQSLDTLANVPPATLGGSLLALYDTSLMLHNSAQAGFGGMLAFLNVSAGGPGPGGAPTTSNVVVTPSTTNGLVDVTITADIVSDIPTVAAAEYFIDVRGADGTGTPMAAVDASFDSATESVTATLLAADVNALSSGTHTIYVHGQDALDVWGLAATATLTVNKSGPTTGPVSLSPNPTDELVDVTVSAAMTDPDTVTAAEFYINSTSSAAHPMTVSVSYVATGTISTTDLASLLTGDHTIYVRGQNTAGVWGAFNFAVLHLDKDGPMTKSIVLSPNPSSGAVAVNIQATGDDSLSGGSNVTLAQYKIDTTGTWTGMSVSPVAPIASLNGTIDATTMGGLVEGEHTLYIRSQDAFLHWGMEASAPLRVDKTGPDTSDVLARPNPNNGALPYSPSQLSVRVDATISEPGAGPVTSNVKTAEFFIDYAGELDGRGVPMTPYDGLFNSPTEAAYSFIALVNINNLSEGDHTIDVHGQDASGNWGPISSTPLKIDKTKPVVSSVITDYTGGAATFNLTASATDVATGGSNIARAEYYVDSDPGAGNGTPMQATDGDFNSSTEGLIASVNAGGLTAGPHILYVRARDAAGNWSLTGSVDVTIVPPDAIFADSFQSGDLTAWNGGAVGLVNASPAALMDGDGFGMAVTLAGNNPGYVIDNSPTAEPSYHARFYFNPNGTVTGNNQAYTIFAGLDPAGTTIFRVQYRRQNQAGGTYQVRGWVQTVGGVVVTTNWVAITNNQAHSIEIAWSSGTAATFSLTVDGTLQPALTGLNTVAYLLDTVQLGPSVGLTGAANGTLYFDAFVSRRNTVIGP